jgi:hypothetical protein
MTSDKQLHANRANATKSTGPRSQAGKDRSRLNSRKHGLTAKMLIIVGEYADDFDQLRAALLDEHDPRSALECELVERLAGILWRLRRVPLFEAAILDARHSQVLQLRLSNSYRAYEETEKDGEEANRQEHLGCALIDDARYSDALGKLARHETTLMNAFAKTLQMLLLLQDKRSNTESKPVVLEAVALPPAA